jgi:hypothetical protein
VLRIRSSFSNNEIKNEAVEIEVIVKDSKDIYEQYGFRSLVDKALNADLESYIMSSIKNYPLKRKVNIVISFIIEGENMDISKIEKIIQTHFKFKAEEMDLSLKQQFRQWKINMTIGVLFLILCLILVEVLEQFSPTNIVKIIKESLLIIGWVALWEPITFILFGWRNIKANKLYYEKLSHIGIMAKKIKGMSIK